MCCLYVLLAFNGQAPMTVSANVLRSEEQSTLVSSADQVDILFFLFSSWVTGFLERTISIICEN